MAHFRNISLYLKLRRDHSFAYIAPPVYICDKAIIDTIFILLKLTVINHLENDFWRLLKDIDTNTTLLLTF